MKPLLETTDPKYLRRLVRELNSEGMVNGFYATSSTLNLTWRCNRARLRNGTLECRTCGCSKSDPAWFRPKNLEFVTVYEKPIVASRRQ